MCIRDRSMTVEAARTAAAAFISCRLDYCNSLLFGLPDTLLRKLQSVQNATARLSTGKRRRDHITPVLLDLQSTGYPSESASSSKWHSWFTSSCLGRRLSTWQMTAVLFLTVSNAHCGQRTFRLAWCREHSAAMVIELLQPQDPACGTLFQSNYAIRTSPTDCSDNN